MFNRKNVRHLTQRQEIFPDSYAKRFQLHCSQKDYFSLFLHYTMDNIVARPGLTHIGQTFLHLHHAKIKWQCAATDKEGKKTYSLPLTLTSGEKKKLYVEVDHGINTIFVLTCANRQLVFKMIGNPSYTNLRIVWSDGKTIGEGLSNHLLPPEDNIDVVNFNRQYKFYKRCRGANSGEAGRILGADIRHVHNAQPQMECIDKVMFLNILDQELDGVTLTLLVAQMIMMAVLDPGLSQSTTNPKFASIPPEVQTVFNPRPEKCHFIKAATLMMRDLRTDFYVLSDISHQPMYIFEVSCVGSDRLNILDASSLSPVLLADNATNHTAVCTVTTSRNATVGSIFNKVAMNATGQVVLYCSREQSTPDQLTLYDSDHTTQKTHKFAEFGLQANVATLKFFRDPRPAARVLLLPYLFFASLYFFNMNVMLVKRCNSKEDAYDRITQLSQQQASA